MLTGEWIEKKVSESKIVENSFFVKQFSSYFP